MTDVKKTPANNFAAFLRRLWSLQHLRISLLSILLISLFLCVYNKHEFGYLSHVTAFSSDPQIAVTPPVSEMRIACLIVIDGSDEATFEQLTTYGIFLRSHCDVKAFVVESHESDAPFFNASFVSSKIAHAEVITIPNTPLGHWQRRRFHNYHVLSYAFIHYLEHYHWFLKMPALGHLLLVDSFRKMLKHKRYNMSAPQLLGHVIEYEACENFVYALTVYAINTAFVNRVGRIAYERVEANAINVDDEVACETSSCKHHSENDYGSFCLRDMNVNVAPVRDHLDRDYFLIFQAKDHFFAMNEWRENDWYWYGKNKQSVGAQCCAEYPIVFSNYKKSKTLRKYYNFIYDQPSKQRTIRFIAELGQQSQNR